MTQVRKDHVSTKRRWKKCEERQGERDGGVVSTVTPDGPPMSRVCRSVSELAAIRGAPPSPQQGGPALSLQAQGTASATASFLTFGSNGEGGISGPLGGELTPERGH